MAVLQSYQPLNSSFGCENVLIQNRRFPLPSLPQSKYISRSSGRGSELYAYQIRSSTAEHLYIVLQSKDLGWEPDEQVEEILLETEWYVT